MTKPFPKQASPRHLYQRQASILTEVLVAALLLSAGVAMVARTHSSLRRLWIDTRHYQLATDELCNQLQRLQRMPADEVAEALTVLAMDASTSAVLPDAEISGEVIDDELGHRVRLSINWQRAGQPDPLVLVGWLAHANPTLAKAAPSAADTSSTAGVQESQL